MIPQAVSGRATEPPPKRRRRATRSEIAAVAHKLNCSELDQYLEAIALYRSLVAEGAMPTWRSR